MKSNKTTGITLIALVLTIIVLVILATISINAVFGDNGLIAKTEKARETQELAEELERLEIIKGEVLTDIKNKGKISVDIYVDELISKGIVDVADVTAEADGSKTVITDTGYEVNIAPDGPHNVIITINGKAGSASLKPKIKNVTTSLVVAKEIGVTIDADNADSYEIQYKKTTESSYKSAYSGKNNSYTIKGLDEDAIYNIRIIVTNSYGSKIRDVNARAGLPSGTGAITFTDFAWKSGKAEVKINKTIAESYDMRYRVEDSAGTEKVAYTVIASGATIGNLEHGYVVEAQLWNGSIGGSTATFTVGDAKEPNPATLTYYDETDTEITGNIEIENGETIKIKVEQSDNESGVEIANCKWIINTNSGSIGTNEASYTGGTFTSTPENITYTSSSEGEYYLHILTIDKAGKPKETVSKMIKVKAPEPITVTGDELKGAFIKYDVEYTDTYYSSYQYTSTNGWRLMDYDLDTTDTTGKTLKNVKLISTGIPAKMYYFSTDTSNNYSKWVTTDTTKLTTFKDAVLGSGYTTYTGSLTDYKALQASAGFYYNLGSMTFTQGTLSASNSSDRNKGSYIRVKNGRTEYTSGSRTGNTLFKARSDASIRMLTLPELNAAVGVTDVDSTSTINDTTGLYQLNKISTGTALTSNTYSSSYYILASPWPISHYSEAISVVESTGSIDLSQGLTQPRVVVGVRPVITLSAKIQLLRKKATTTDGTAYQYYEIK